MIIIIIIIIIIHLYSAMMSWISVIASFKEVFFFCRRLYNIPILLFTLTTQNKVTIKCFLSLL
jgi:hypothetical protein